MREMQWNRGLRALGAAVLGLFTVTSVAAAAPQSITTEQGGSVIVFPKVIWDGERDTVIEITTTSNMPTSAHCYYADASRPGEWNETDFHIYLTRQQPTQWIVSAGRAVQVSPFGRYGAGFDPGLIPPVDFPFTGELKCVQVDDGGDPDTGDKLTGTATLRYVNGDVSKYNAVALRAAGGTPGGEKSALYLDGKEYSACPNELIVTHALDGSPDVGGTKVYTELTLVPCFEDFENQTAGITTVQYAWQREDTYPRPTLPNTGSFTVDCWLNTDLSKIPPGGNFNFTAPPVDSAGALLVLRPVAGQPGVIGVVEERRVDKNLVKSGHAAANLVGVGARPAPATGPSIDQIILSQ